MAQLNEEQINSYSIWQLREFARQLGHHAPATLRKQELVAYILKCQQEGVTLEKVRQMQELDPKPRRGRPPKSRYVSSDSAPSNPWANPAKTDVSLPHYEVGLNDSAPTPAYAEQTTEGYGADNNGGYAPKGSGYTAGAPQPQQEKINTGSQDEVPAVKREGVLEICPDGYGFLRARNCEQGAGDAYISAVKIRKSGLRKGDYVVAYAKKLAENRPVNVTELISVNGEAPEAAFNRKNFDSLTPIYPESRLKLETEDSRKNDFAIRAIDLVAPIGKGQRAMIVSPPKAGKTTLLKKIANAIATNYPDVHLIVLLIDERPEEVTDMQRSIQGEVIYSTFDEMPEHHTKAAEMVLERAKRLVELGKDVVILMDSLTRLARAYNLVITPTGKTLSGGIDPGALHSPKRFFGAARNIEHGGSLTIIATALVDTGSRMDDVIYEEFKGTGNMEIHLDRKLSEKRIFPAIDLARSSTRREELLLSQKEIEGIWAMRKMLSAGDGQEATEQLLNMLIRTKSNREFIDQLTLQLLKLQKEGYNFRGAGNN